MVSARTTAVCSIFLCLFIIGFVLMGYEMLGSRYLNPYFGGGITTWAGLISIVLFAMMVGYLSGGYIADAMPTLNLLAILCFLAGLSIALMTVIADPLLNAILGVFGDQLTGVLLAASAISFVPVALLSACSPFVVRILLQDLEAGGKTAGWVYGISTLGNVLGTLVTTFSFIPHFGTRTITLYFGVCLVILSIIIFLLRYRITSGLGLRYVLAILAIAVPFIILPNHDLEAGKVTSRVAWYPEGPYWIKDQLYFAEMSKHRVTSISDKSRSHTFWSEEGCGPTSISEYGINRFLILCHLAAKLVVIDNEGTKLNEISEIGYSPLFQNPNDSHSDGEGGVFFSDSGVFKKSAPATGAVYHITSTGNTRKIIKDLHYANGIAFDASNRKLYVSEHLAGKVWVYKINGDFTAGARTLLFDISSVWKPGEIDYAETGPDGIEILNHNIIAVAIYGKGSIILLKGSKIRKYAVDTKFVTNISGNGSLIAITGAYTNRNFPYKGAVKIIPAADLRKLHQQ